MRPLPFLYDAELVEQGGVHVADIVCSIWPAQNQESNDSGEHFTHTGEAPAALAGVLTHNRSIVVSSGDATGTYKIVGATKQWAVPHIGLELLRTDAGGG